MGKSSQTICAIIFLLSFVQWTTQRPSPNDSSDINTSGCGRLQAFNTVEVFVTVSSLSTRIGEDTVRHLEVNWFGRTPQKDDRVGLFSKDPSKSARNPLVVVDPNDHPDGHFRTEVEFPYTYFNLTCLTKNPCLGYWVGYFSSDKLVSSSCLQMRPFWMQENKKYIESRKLSDMMIPGSHDSGSFSRDMGRSIDIVTKYKFAQEESIFNQLVYGLRYFDFRIGYYKYNKGKFFINHSIFRTNHSVESILQEVRSFISATEEVVILDLHDFPIGFSKPEVHLELMNMLYNTLEEYLIPYNDTFLQATMGQLWKSGKRVLINYDNEKRSLDTRGLLWPGFERAWGNKQKPEDLKIYFEKIFSNRVPKSMWISMAELTPDEITIAFHPCLGLRIMADEINRNVTRWFRDSYWNKANIVATDFFLGNDLIDVSIKTNRMKYYCAKNKF